MPKHLTPTLCSCFRVWLFCMHVTFSIHLSETKSQFSTQNPPTTFLTLYHPTHPTPTFNNPTKSPPPACPPEHLPAMSHHRPFSSPLSFSSPSFPSLTQTTFNLSSTSNHPSKLPIQTFSLHGTYQTHPATSPESSVTPKVPSQKSIFQ